MEMDSEMEVEKGGGSDKGRGSRKETKWLGKRGRRKRTVESGSGSGKLKKEGK